MANSVDDIQPDLNKAPPHVEGELLKQNIKATFGRKGWRKFFFIVKADKLQYFRKKDDYLTNKDPVAFVRMSQVTEITEAIFTGVPKKHHLNCGFNIVSYHPLTQEEQTFSLLAETQEEMRYWVFGLRYIKAYWSKMKVRDTVLSADQERKLLDRILQAEDHDPEDEVYGDYGDDGQPSDQAPSRQISVYFANESKVKVTLSMAQTSSDLLEMSEIKEQLSSSSAYIVRVDDMGNDVILEPQEHPALNYTKGSTLYVVELTHRLLVVFLGGLKEFESIFVSHHATASDVIEHEAIRLRLDVTGVANRGLFLKSQDNEQPFGVGESPCDALFAQETSGGLRRLSVGRLVVRNKALGGGRSSTRVTRRINRTINRPMKRTISEEGRHLEEISEQEEAETRALDRLQNRKQSGPSVLESTTEVNIDGEVYVLPPDYSSKDSKRNSSGSVNSDPGDDSRAEDDARKPRPRASYISDKPLSSSPYGSPATSPPRSRSKSPGRRLPELPEKNTKISPGSQKKSHTLDIGEKGSPSGGLRRRGATRGGSVRTSAVSEGRGSVKETVPTVKITNDSKEGVTDEKVGVASASTRPIALHKRGPTIVHNEKANVPANARTDRPTHTAPRPRSPSTRAYDNLHTGDSRSSYFGHPQSPVDSISSSHFDAIHPTKSVTDSVPVSVFGTNMGTALSVDDETRLENLFSRSFQQEQEEKSVQGTQQVDTLSAKVKAVIGDNKEQNKAVGKSPDGSPGHHPITPMLINFEALQQNQEAPPTANGESINSPSKSTTAIKVTSPSFLKVILLQSSEATDLSEETKPMDFINLSGVCLRNERGKWVLQGGYNYHDPLPFDCVDHTETFPLPGGIRVVYNHTHKRWHVYPPPLTDHTLSESASVTESTEQDLSAEDVDSRETSAENSLYLSKKTIVTELGTAFHHIMEQFEVTRDQAEKKKIGSDMINASMGHTVRGEFCTAVARLILDGLKPYRFEGLIQDNIWKVTVAFSNEAQSNPSSPLVYPAFDKQIFQPINSLKTLMRDNNVKFRTFVCLAMSRGLLAGFLEALPTQTNTLKKFYYPNAFLRLAANHPPYQALYQQMLVTLEPMVHLPFDLSIDFEARQAMERARQPGPEEARPSERSPSDVSESSSVSDQSNSLTVRPVVVVKTHAATGQRSTAGNVKNVVWDTSPLHSLAKGQVMQEETDNDGQVSSITALRQLQDNSRHTSTALAETPSTQPQTRPTNKPSQRKKDGPWWKKLSDSLMELNMGGAITGPPKNLRQQQPQKPQSPPSAPPDSDERKVKALYNNIGDDADELNFKKDDILIVKDQINEEWLICMTGDRSGIVPVSYVQPLC